MRVVFQDPQVPEPRYQATPRIPIRQNLLAPNGTVYRIPIDERAPDAHTIIAAIQNVIDQFGRDPRVRGATVELLNSRYNNDIRSHANTIAQWVMNHMVYLMDPDGGEFVQTPLVLLSAIAKKGFAYGDCDDHVVLLGAMLVSIGIPARAVAVKLHGAEHYNHVVIEYPYQNSWILIDPCAKLVRTPNYRDRLVAI